MVDIVQSNINKLLIRKIGYSVGLEATLDRINLLVDLFIDQNEISSRSWVNLVTQGYKRQEVAVKHFENLFEVMGILSVSSGRPIPQQILDVFALLKVFYSDDKNKYDLASKAILLYAITLSDGELFSALLNAEFDESQILDGLNQFRASKLMLFYEKYPAKSLKAKLHRVINFEEIVQEKNLIRSKNLSAMMRPPFAGGNDNKQVQDIDDFSVSLSNDWFKKVPGRRQAWAEDLGLFQHKSLTTAGEKFLINMRSLLPEVYRERIGDNKSIIIMPIDIEMSSHNISWLLDDDMIMKFNNLLSLISDTYAGPEKPHDLPVDTLVEEILPFCFENYVKADIRFTRLRRELPYTILGVFCLGYCVAERLSFIDLDKALESDQRNKIKYSLRSSRKSSFGISLKD